jgi:Protein of unknown function (DUF2955)
MPIESSLGQTRAAMHPLAARRILRLALGTALSLWFSQAVSWQLSYLAPVLTLLLLALPLPALSLKQGIGFVIALLLPVIASMALLPFLWHARWAGVLLIALALYGTFYFTARGGPAVMGTLMTVGLTITVTVGSINPSIIIVLIVAMAKCAVFGVLFVWVAHALLPDPPPDPTVTRKPPPPAVKPDLSTARWNALRSLAVVFPIALVFLFMSGSPAYTVVMIKTASMGQQATADQSRQMAQSLLSSTLWGGFGALIGWTLLSAWPSLLFYTLLVALAGLLFGRGIFQGPAVHPNFSMWSYAFLTMLVILAPALLDGQGSDGAGVAIWSRVFLFILIAVYGSTAVAVFDAFFPGKASGSASAS